MEFRRLKDYAMVRQVLTWPEIYPQIGDDYIPPAADFQVNDHPDIWYVGASSSNEMLGLIGLFSLIPKSRVCWELHVAMLPWASTREKWEAARSLPVWLKDHTECKRLTAEVPACNWPALIYGTHGIGMRHVGRHAAAFMKGGELQDLIILGLSIGS